MAGATSTSSSVDPVGNVDVSDESEDELKLKGAMSWDSFAANCRKYSTSVMLKDVSEILASLGGEGKSVDLVSASKLLPKAIRACLDEEVQVVAEFHPNQEEFHAEVFEALSGLVDFTVAFLSNYIDDHSNKEFMRPSLQRILAAVSMALDSKMRFYSLSRERSEREILVLPSRLECALRVPGYFVKVCGDADGKTHYFCSHKGVNELGVACECCTRPLEADATLVNICWQFVKSGRRSGWECLLKILNTLEEPSFEPTLNLLLRPFVLVLEYLIKDKSWSVVLEHMDRNFSEIGGMIRICHSAYQKVFQNLTNTLNLHLPKIIWSRHSFIETLIHLHTISSWSVLYFRSYPSAAGAAFSFEDADKLLLVFLERTVVSGRVDLLCPIVGEFINARLVHASGHDLPFVNSIVRWLKEEKHEDLVVRELLLSDVAKLVREEMIKFVELVGKGGLVMQKEDFVTIIKCDLVSEKDLLAKRYAQARVAAAVLVNFSLDPYVPEFMKDVCDWLERWQAKDSVITSPTVCCILEKLVVCDKDKKWENRLLSLLWNEACKLPDSEFVVCLRRIACHYTIITEPRISLQPGEERENFLQSCSRADKETTVACNMGIKFEEKTIFAQRAKIYQDMEVDFNFETSLQLRHLLNIDIPLASHESSKKCLERLDQAQHLISGLKTTPHNHMETVMVSSVAPELQALEAIKKEIVLRSELRQSMQEANETHLEYNRMKEDHNQALVKFFEDCLQEKKKIVKDSLYAKAKVMAAVEMANLESNTKVTSDDILTRMLQKTEYTLEKAKAKNKRSLEKVPNSECNVCFVDFSLKRKRACFDACGHAGSCIDCGIQHWRRTKTCPLCASETRKPIAVPSMLFFGRSIAHDASGTRCGNICGMQMSVLDIPIGFWGTRISLCKNRVILEAGS